MAGTMEAGIPAEADTAGTEPRIVQREPSVLVGRTWIPPHPGLD